MKVHFYVTEVHKHVKTLPVFVFDTGAQIFLYTVSSLFIWHVMQKGTTAL